MRSREASARCCKNEGGLPTKMSSLKKEKKTESERGEGGEKEWDEKMTLFRLCSRAYLDLGNPFGLHCLNCLGGLGGLEGLACLRSMDGLGLGDLVTLIRGRGE